MQSLTTLIISSFPEEKKIDITNYLFNDIYKVKYYDPVDMKYNASVYVFAESEESALVKAFSTKTFREKYFIGGEHKKYKLIPDPERSDYLMYGCFDCKKDISNCLCDDIIFDNEGIIINEEGYRKHILYLSENKDICRIYSLHKKIKVEE